MSTRNGSNIPARNASDGRPRWVRAELRQRYERRDLLDALNEARGLIHFDRVLVGA